jgi:hypothetical protein
MVVHVYNPSTWGELRQEDFKLKNSLGYIERPCLKDKRKKIPVLYLNNHMNQVSSQSAFYK